MDSTYLRSMALNAPFLVKGTEKPAKADYYAELKKDAEDKARFAEEHPEACNNVTPEADAE